MVRNLYPLFSLSVQGGSDISGMLSKLHRHIKNNLFYYFFPKNHLNCLPNINKKQSHSGKDESTGRCNQLQYNYLLLFLKCLLYLSSLSIFSFSSTALARNSLSKFSFSSWPLTRYSFSIFSFSSRPLARYSFLTYTDYMSIRLSTY
jgi:hypothetical protein